MMGKYKFVECFWEIDFNGTLGFDLLCRRIKDGYKMCKDIEEFFKKKAKAEAKYGKAMRILAKSVEGKEDSGDLGNSWQELNLQTDRTARFHEDASTENNKLADEISKFSEQLKMQSKQMEDKVKEDQKLKRTTHAKLLELQRSYHEKCREHVQSEAHLDTAKQRVTTTTKDIEKLKIRAVKGREAMEKADVLYKQTVEFLEQVRRDWESDTEVACEVFQRQEEERIDVLRDCLWKYTNIGSQLNVDSDESCEIVRSCLEKCDVDGDIDEFVKNRMTGRMRPEPILYDNYFEEAASPKSDSRSTVSTGAGRRRPPPPSAPSQHSSDQYSSIYSQVE